VCEVKWCIAEGKPDLLPVVLYTWDSPGDTSGRGLFADARRLTEGGPLEVARESQWDTAAEGRYCAGGAFLIAPYAETFSLMEGEGHAMYCCDSR
jgi:hypothetical protein